MQRFLVGLLALAMFLATPFPGVAQQADGGPHNVIIPQRRVVLPLPDAPVRLDSVGVEADIREQVSTTTVTIVVSNPGPRPQEAQLLLPVPDGSAVRQFRLEGLPDEGVAKLLPRDEARRIYDDIVRRTLDPGLVEFVGYNLIRTSVFPVPANGTQRLHLTYEQVLPADGERIDYVFPRSESLEASDVKWSMGVTIRAERTVTTVYSPTHEIVTERSPGRIRVTVPERAATEPGAFRLSYLLARPEAGGASASLIAYPDPRVGATAAGAGDGGYFLLLAALPPLENGKDRTIRREVTVVIDRSGSMRGEKMDQARAAALMIIEALDEGEAFNIIDYSDTIEAFAPQPVLKNAETIARAREYVGAMQAMGGTNIHDALLTALRPPVTEGCLPIVLFLTDGLATVGERREGAAITAGDGRGSH
ncbi:MAG TPA: VIT domain-containing protein, partial [Phycisphaerales bacterium]|nr:VIT domain-containing protein [Phycisphaerales bacterium]